MIVAQAAPPKHPFVRAWRDEFRTALTEGVARYCHSLPYELITPGLKPSLEHGYLAIHAAWRAARARLPDTPFRLASPVERCGPYRYLAAANWDSPAAVQRLFEAPAEDLAATPLIKLRGRERDSVQPLASYGRSSALARALMASTIPSTVVERMSFLRLGLDPDAPLAKKIS